MHYVLCCIKQMGLFSCTLFERLPLMFITLSLIRGWCGRPQGQRVQSYQDFSSDFWCISHSDLRSTPVFLELPARSVLVLLLFLVS